MIEQARRIIAQAGRVVSFSGAGLSAESGVPTFRDAQTDGLWGKHDPMRLASPQGFADDPELVSQWYAHRRRAIAEAQPNGGHIALAQQSKMIHITQNVDDLLHRAGAQHVIQLHGTIAHDRCNGECGFREAVDMTDPPALHTCPQCGDQLRPAVVWFGEALPNDAWSGAERACSECEVLLVIGTSAVVYPAAGLIGLAKSGGARIIIINTHQSDASSLADVEVLGKASEVVPAILDEPTTIR